LTQTWLLVFARAAGLVARAPGFAHPSVPSMVRAGVAAALAAAIAPTLHAAPQPDLASLVIAIAGEAAIGAALGFGAALLYDGAYFAGRTIDDYLGVRGSVPGANVTSSQGFGRLWSGTFLCAFVLLDGWVPVVWAFAGSFTHLAPGTFPARVAWMHFALTFPATLLQAALLIASPAIAVAATLQLALAAVSRVVPRFGAVGLAFPVVFAGALAVTVLTLPLLVPLGARPWFAFPWSAGP
jgi:flagellar biosynthesis protein FliR